MKSATRVLALLLLGLPAASAHRGATVSARVLDLNDGSPVVAAEVALIGTEFRGRTDSVGRVRLLDVPAGAYEVGARRVGFKPVTARVVVSSGDSVEIALAMQVISVALPGMKVTETVARIHLREFDERLRNHVGGYFITDSVIRNHEPDGIDALLHARVPGIRANRRPGGDIYVYSARGSTSLTNDGPCGVEVFLDGVRMGDSNAGVVPLFDLAGIEYYPPGFAPVQYRVPPPIGPKGQVNSGGAACGVLLLWTRP